MYGGDHYDRDGDKICDECDTAYITMDMAINGAAFAALEADLTAAIKKAVDDGDYSALKQLAHDDDNFVDSIVECYNSAVSDGITPDIRLLFNQFVVTAVDAASDPDLQTYFDDAEKAVAGGTAEFVFTMDIVGEIDTGDSVSSFSLANHASSQPMEYTINIDADDVAENRAWYVLVKEDDSNVFTKLAKSEKGASEITFTAVNMYNVFALVYAEREPIIDEVYGEIDYSVEGSVVTINQTESCKVGYMSGENYVAIEAVKNTDGTYSFEVPENVEVLVAFNGDVNLTGSVDMDDVVDIARHVLHAETITNAHALALGEVTSDISTDMDDVVKMAQYVLKAIESLD